MPFLGRILVLMSLLLLGNIELSAKQKKEETIPVPPTPISEQFNGYQKEALKITLRATGRIKEPLKFLIRKPPSKGSLGAIRRIGPKAAAVIYTPAVEADSEQDSFSYAVSSVDSPVSAPARITINLMKRKAEFGYPKELDFGVVAIGDSKSIDFSISNNGGEDAPLGMLLNPPWRFAEPPPEFLAAHKEAGIKLIFEPTSSGNFTETLFISKNPLSKVTLRGSSVPAFSWPENGLVISPEMRKRNDLGIPFTNLTQSPRKIEFKWPAYINGDREITILASETKIVPINLDKSIPNSFSSVNKFYFRIGNFTSGVPLVIAPTPAQIDIDPSETIDLGKVSLYQTAIGKFNISNKGGQTASLIFEGPKEITIRPKPSEIYLMPGMSQEFEIFFTPNKSGEFRLPLALGLNEGQMIKLNIHCHVRASRSVEKYLDLEEVQIKPINIINEKKANISPPKDINVDSVGSNSCTLSWEVMEGAKSFLIEERRLNLQENGQITQEWVAWKRNIIFYQAGQKVQAKIKNLPANTFWMIRVTPLDESGAKGHTSKVFKISTTKDNLFVVPFIVWGTVLLIVTILLLFKLGHKSGLIKITSKSVDGG